MARWMTGAAVGLVVVVGAWTRATDARWARAAGLDVWNVPRLEADVRGQEERGDRLSDDLGRSWDRKQVNEQLVRDAVAGRRSLAAAATALWEANESVPGFAVWVNTSFRGPTPVARAAQLLLFRVGEDDGLSAAARAEALARLRTEYMIAFGRPLPYGFGLVWTV